MNRKIIAGILLAKRKRLVYLTNYRISEDTGLTAQQIKSMESGEKNYTIDSLISYDKYLDSGIFNKQI